MVVVVMPASGQNATINTTREVLVVDGEPTTGVASTAGDSCSGGQTHYDGTMEQGYRMFPFTNGTLVERFTTPANNDWTMTRVCVCFTSQPANPSQTYEIVVFDDDGPGGQPGTELYSITDTALNIPLFADNQWYGTTVNLNLPAGETFYIGARWNGNQNAFLCVDNDTSLQTGYGSSDGGTSWTLIQNLPSFSNYRALAVAFILGEPIEEEEVPAVNYPNHGEILIRSNAPVVPYAAPGEYAQAFTLPADYDGNGFDTYVITGTATVGGATWYSIWVGGEDYLWVPASQVQILR